MHQYKLVMFQPTGCIAHVPIKLWDTTNLDAAVEMQVDDYRRGYNYDGPVHLLSTNEPNSFAQTIIKEEVYQ